MKTCIKCHVEQDESAFPYYRRNTCRSCFRVLWRNRDRREAQARLARLQSGEEPLTWVWRNGYDSLGHPVGKIHPRLGTVRV